MWWYLDICVDIWIVYIIQTPTFNSLCKRSKTPRRDIILWWACRRILLTTACSWNGCPGRQSCVPHFVIQWSWSILGYRTGRLWSARFTTPVLLKHNIHPVHKITHRSHSSVHWGTAARFRTQSVECSCACRHALAGLVTLNWLGVSAVCLYQYIHLHIKENSHTACADVLDAAGNTKTFDALHVTCVRKQTVIGHGSEDWYHMNFVPDCVNLTSCQWLLIEGWSWSIVQVRITWCVSQPSTLGTAALEESKSPFGTLKSRFTAALCTFNLVTRNTPLRVSLVDKFSLSGKCARMIACNWVKLHTRTYWHIWKWSHAAPLMLYFHPFHSAHLASVRICNKPDD